MRAEMGSVGIALVGAGPWGLTVAQALTRVAPADLRWICDVKPDRLASARAAHRAARVTETVDDVLTDPAVSAVAVTVDVPGHYPVGLRVLQAGRHLLVEKPMALSSAHGRELIALASAQGRLLSVGDLLLHHPAVRRARELIVEGALGETLYFESTRMAPGPARAPGSTWWALAPHDVSMAMWLFGAVPTHVSATGGAYDQAGHDGVASAVLRFADGRTAHIRVGRFAAEKRRCLSVAGTRRTLTFDELVAERPLTLHEPARRSEGAAAVPVDVADPLLEQCRQFVSCAARGNLAGGNGEHALAVVGVLEAGARSMERGGVAVEVP
jgi:predicted dehydrogenase